MLLLFYSNKFPASLILFSSIQHFTYPFRFCTLLIISSLLSSMSAHFSSGPLFTFPFHSFSNPLFTFPSQVNSTRFCSNRFRFVALPLVYVRLLALPFLLFSPQVILFLIDSNRLETAPFYSLSPLLNSVLFRFFSPHF